MKHRYYRPEVRLLRRCRPPRQALLNIIAWSAVESAPALLSGYSVAHATDAFRAGQPGTALTWLVALGAAIVVGALATRGLYAALAPAVEGTRDRLMTEVARGSLAKVATTGRAGSAALTQLIDQVDQVRNLLSALGRGLRSTLTPLVAAIVGVFALDARLGLVVALPTVLALALYAAMLPRTSAAQRDAALADEQLGDQATAVLDSAAAIRGIGAQTWAADRLATAARATGRADIRVSRVLAARHLVIAIGGYLPLLLVLLAAEPLLRRGQISAGDVLGAMTYVLAALLPALSAATSGTGSWFVQTAVLLNRLAALAHAMEPEPVRRSRDRHSADAIFARQATFEYRAGVRPIISDFDLSVAPGQLVALVGASGTGKSTLAHLAAGLLVPTSGAVGTGGAHQLALVPQTPYVFNGTLRENLAYLAPDDVSDANLTAALDGTGLRPLAERIGGLDTGIEQFDGDRLSTGEQQRIVLARTWLSAADVIVLDEAMTALDAAEEVRIETWLRATGRTVVAISHRLDVTRRADLIIYFDGRNVQCGPHRELISRCPEYRELIAFAAAS